MAKTLTEWIGSLTSRYSSNVILAKARALYGRSLSEKDFHNLMHCHSVGEIAAYLKNNTSYSSVLTGINESTIHRGHLEQLLHRKLFEDYASLGRYDEVAGMHSFLYLIQRSEIETIISSLRLINAGRAGDILFSMPVFFMNHSKLDIAALGKCRTYSDLLGALSGTEYYLPLSRFSPDEHGFVPITDIETVLYTKLTHTAQEIIKRTSGAARHELNDLIGVQSDTQNLNRILRMKRFLHAEPEDIRRVMLPYGTLSPKIMENLINAGSVEEVMQIFMETRLGKRLPKNRDISIYDLYYSLHYFSARRHIHYSLHPSVVMFSYIIIKDVELNDITNVIEGVRYGLAPEQIKLLLVPIGNSGGNHDRKE